MTTILIADDHAIFREGLRQCLESSPDIEVVAEASTGPEAIAQAEKFLPDIVLLDVSMPGRGAIETVQEIKELGLDVRILILTAHPEDHYAIRLLKVGADGYLTKQSSVDVIVKAIRRLAEGGMSISVGLEEKLALSLHDDVEEVPHERLSDREFQVCILIAQGKTLSEIAEELVLSVKTISTYRSRILEKMELSNNVGIMQYCIQEGLTDHSSSSSQTPQAWRSTARALRPVRLKQLREGESEVVEETDKPLHKRLTKRQFQICGLIAKGKRSSNIAERLSVDTKTVLSDLRRAQEELGVMDEAGIAAYWARKLDTPDSNTAKGGLLSRLSEREFRFCALLTGGKTTPDISATLGLDEEEINILRSGVLKKLDLSDNVDLSTYWMREVDPTRFNFTISSATKDLLGSVAHSLRTELFTISTIADHMQKTLSDESKRSEGLQSIQRSARYGSVLLEKLSYPLGIGMPAADKLSLKSLLDDVGSLTSGRLPEKIEVCIRSDEAENVEVLADSTQLLAVLMELIDNASRELRSKGGTIEVVAQESETGALVSVIDSGSGIPESLRPRLLSERVESSSGTGLGLLLCRNVLRSFGGGLRIDKTGRDGTTITVELRRREWRHEG